jgi:hypothetical protein
MSKTLTQRARAKAEIKERYARVKPTLNERARRLFAASEAMAFGWGGLAAVARATGMSIITVQKGIKESKEMECGSIKVLPVERSRRPGGGRKKLTELDATLLPTLRELVGPR